MIKLSRGQKPSYLTDEKVKELTDEFISNQKNVWNNNHIKEALLLSSNGKCAYCECSLTTESNYMEVEHFEDKSNNPDKVVLWSNLLPSCKKCNGSKSTHDVISDPIINPYEDDPREHLALRLYRLRGRTDKGVKTIDITSLNNSDRLVMSRFEIGEKIHELVEVSWDRYHVYMERKDTRSRNRVVAVIEGLLKECQPTSGYAASTATILLTDTKFLELIESMKSEEIWSVELEAYFAGALPIVLECA
jgi:uncharacterized protein (TIGR02646 family)